MNLHLNIEKQLEETYSQMLLLLSTGMTPEQGHQEIKKAIELCKEQSIKDGTTDLPNNYGKLLIRAAKSGDVKSKKIVDKALKEGATEKDIEEFWSLNDLQRRMVVWSETSFRYMSFSQFKDDGLNSDEAMVKVRKMFPMYGDPDDTTNTTGEDRPLPHELRGRIDKYRTKYGAANITDKVKNYSSYNAFIRDEIKKGNL